MYKQKSIKVLLVLVMSLLACLGMLSACGNKRDFAKLDLQDGTYKGYYQDEDEDYPSSLELEITIEAGKITACKAAEFSADGEVKGEKYAAISPEAAKAVEGLTQYPDLLLEKQDPNAIDAISGATVSLKRFQEAVWNALDKAVK